mgnify:CR=1
AHPSLMGFDADDRINLLGYWLDQDRGEVMAADVDALSAMVAIGAEFLDGQDISGKWGGEVNFVVMSILREK